MSHLQPECAPVRAESRTPAGSPQERSRNVQEEAIQCVRGAAETWTGSPELARTAAEAFYEYLTQLNTYRDAGDDPRATQALQRRVGDALLAAHKDARKVVLEAAEAGLEHHTGECLISPDPLQVALRMAGGDPQDELWYAWRWLDFMLGVLGLRSPEVVVAGLKVRAWPGAYGVCESCTLIHRRTRSDQRRCQRCRKRRPAPAVIGRGHAPIRKGGTPVTTRVDRWLGQPLGGWKTVTIGLCKECGEPFHGRSDKRKCHSDVCRGRHSRRASD